MPVEVGCQNRRERDSAQTVARIPRRSLTPEEIEHCFEETFGTAFQVRLLGGFSEPFYRPPTHTAVGELRYRDDHAASALHEVAHWCIAGAARRCLPDFGYGYVAAPRSEEEQRRFLAFEVAPQALEWCLADHAGVTFHFSFDDVEDRFVDLRPAFCAAVRCRRQQLLQHGPGLRASRFALALSAAVEGIEAAQGIEAPQ